MDPKGKTVTFWIIPCPCGVRHIVSLSLFSSTSLSLEVIYIVHTLCLLPGKTMLNVLIQGFFLHTVRIIVQKMAVLCWQELRQCFWGHRVHRESISQRQLLFLSNRQQQTDRPHPCLTLVVTYMPRSRRYQTNRLACSPWLHDDFPPMNVFLAFFSSHNVRIVTVDQQHDIAAGRICVCLIVMLWVVCT